MRTIIMTLSIAAGAAIAGPDLICSEINGATSYGFVDGKVAYSFGTTLCNIGSMPVSYEANTNQHPLIAQSIYKLKDHRIEQIGIGFVRHTNIPLAGNACGLGCTPAGLDALGVGCSDTSSSSINGTQAMMGPRTEVGSLDFGYAYYAYPFTSMNQTGDAIYKRLQVSLEDVSDPDALYFVETQLIVPSDFLLENVVNNVSYRQVIFSPGSATATLVGPTYDQQPAIFAWRDHGNGIGVPDETVMISVTDSSGSEEDVIVGSRATNIEGDLWRYDYEIFNLYKFENVEALTMMFDGDRGAELISTEFRSPRYHDDLDEDLSDLDWSNTSIRMYFDYSFEIVSSVVPTPDPALRNTVRWGTMYGISYMIRTTSMPDNEGLIELESDFRYEDYVAVVPSQGPAFCPPDLDGDGRLTFFDVSIFIQRHLSGDDYNGDLRTDFFDISLFLQQYNSCLDNL